MHRLLSFLLAAALGLFALPSLADDAAAQFHDAWIRAAPPGSRVLAGYVRIVNGTERERVLVRAESPDFDAVQFHEMRMQDGVMQMRPLSELRITPGGTLELTPGGRHLMLHRPKRALRAGDRVRVDFVFSDESRRSLEFEIRR